METKSLLIKIYNETVSYDQVDTGSGRLFLQSKDDYSRLAKNLIDWSSKYSHMSDIEYKNLLNEMFSDNKSGIVAKPRNLEDFTSSSGHPSIGTDEFPIQKPSLKKLDMFERLNSRKLSSAPDLDSVGYNSVGSDVNEEIHKLASKTKSRVSFNLKSEDLKPTKLQFDHNPSPMDNLEQDFELTQEQISKKPQKKNILQEIRKHIGSETQFATEDLEFGGVKKEKKIEKEQPPAKEINWHQEQKIDFLRKSFFTEKNAEKEFQVQVNVEPPVKKPTHRKLNSVNYVPTSHTKKSSNIEYESPFKQTTPGASRRNSQAKGLSTIQPATKQPRISSVDSGRSLSQKFSNVKAKINTGLTPKKIQFGSKENIQIQNKTTVPSQNLGAANQKILQHHNSNFNCETKESTSGFKNEKLMQKFNDKNVENFDSKGLSEKKGQFVNLGEYDSLKKESTTENFWTNEKWDLVKKNIPGNNKADKNSQQKQANLERNLEELLTGLLASEKKSEPPKKFVKRSKHEVITAEEQDWPFVGQKFLCS